MQWSVAASILAFFLGHTAAQYTVIALPPQSLISPISPLPPTSTSTLFSTSSIHSIATITVAPIPYFHGTLVNTTNPLSLSRNTTSCAQTLCIDYINTCGIMYGGCFPHCSNMTTPSFTNPGCPRNKFYPGKTPDASMTTATCGYKCDNFVDECGQTYGPGCYTSCEGMATPEWTTPVCGVTLSGVGIGAPVTSGLMTVRESGEAVESAAPVQSGVWTSEGSTSFSATVTGAVYSQILEDETR